MPCCELKGERVPIRLWADPSSVEEEALQQLRRVAALPWVFHHVAAMADVHTGIGATIGSVIAMRGAVAPAAVGVDIGCFAGDTEVPVLDGSSRSLRELADQGGDWLVYSCTGSGRIRAAPAKALLTRRDAPLIEIALDSGARIRCTPDQLFLLRDGTYSPASDLVPGHSLMPIYRERDRFGYTLVQQNHSGRWQKAHWIVARSGLLGPIPRFEGQRTVIHHRNFQEEDNAVENLVFMGDRDHSAFHRNLVERNTHWQSESFEANRKAALARKARTEEGHRFYALRGTLNLVKYMKAHPGAFRKAVAGNGRRGSPFLVAYNQSEKGREKSRELAHRIHTCDICGEQVRSYIGLHNHRKSKHHFNHRIASVTVLEVREDVYCLQVPGVANFALAAGVFVHNCGMAAVRTSLAATDLPDSLHGLRAEIEAAVPVGFAEHREPLGWPGAAPLLARFAELDPGVQGLAAKAARQVGTLGGGNHFLELCLDERDRAWLLLHSGSRHIGKELAERHIARARRLAHNAALPDPDLAVFLAGSAEMAAYRRDLFWAQAYALENRRALLHLWMEVLAARFPAVAFDPPVVCHHNYVAEEVHFGEEVLVTRKGAIRAGRGELGIIPGSMGTPSFVVRGLGSAEAFDSASHGAGRRMSRHQAKKRFTAADLEAQTRGVECRKDRGVLDEIPGAYKDIHEVIERQSDLVEVVHTLKQVLCVKG